MEPFAFCLALGPLGVYFLALTALNLSRRPMVTTQGREIAAMSLALAGFVLAGPMQLFFPQYAASRFGWFVWVLLVAFYLLCMLLWILVARPRIVVYNMTAAELHPVLEQAALRLDHGALWIGNHLLLPNRRVELDLDNFRTMRNVSLVAAGDVQSPTGWSELYSELRGALRSISVAPNPRGFSLLSSGVLLWAAILYRAWSDPAAVAQGFFDMLLP